MPRKRFIDRSIASSDITPESVFLNRRRFTQSLMGGAGLAAAGAGLSVASHPAQAKAGSPLEFAAAEAGSGFNTDEALTPERDATSYNNFYEFGTDKSDPARYAREMTVDPWSVEVTGLVNKPGKLNLEDLMTGFDLQERESFPLGRLHPCHSYHMRECIRSTLEYRSKTISAKSVNKP